MNEEKSLEFLKAKMTEQQRREMAEVISNEIQRREGLKKGSASRDTMKEIYADTQRRLAEAKAGPSSRSKAKPAQTQSAGLATSYSMPKMTNIAAMSSKLPLKNIDIVLLVAAIVLCGAKVVTRSAGEFTTKTQVSVADATIVPTTTVAPAATNTVGMENLSSEKQLLMELDSRRTELEKRKAALDTKEDELKEQARALAERTAELKGLNTRLSQVKKERDAQYDARMEQLSNVYASMAPTEAAPLISKLDTNTALEILRRMPGKRIGQILGAIAPDRAVQLTKELTDRKMSIRE